MSVLKSRKARALLAGGVVLGVGASMTLAAWTDSEWASGTFGTGGFTFQGSTTGVDGSFDDHVDSTSAAAMTFTLAADAAALKPGDTVTGSYWVKTNGPTAKVTVQPAKLAGTANELSDALDVTIYNGDCATGASIGSGDLTVAGAASARDVGAAPVQTCFKVTLPSDYSNEAALSAVAAWEFKATTATD